MDDGQPVAVLEELLAADGWRRKRAWRDRLPLLGPAEAQIQSGLRCGDLQVTGHQRVDGADALVLTVHFKDASPQTIWVDTRTYLPVQMVTHPDGTYLPAADGTGDVPVTEERTQFHWLAPTTANLAQLTVPAPPGFREVSAHG